MKVILHIGVHKTGTSAIQEFLFRNSGLLGERGVLYDDVTPEQKNHHRIVENFEFGRDNAGGRKAIAGLLKSAHRKNIGAVLLSSEVLVEGRIDLAGFVNSFAGHDVEAIA